MTITVQATNLTTGGVSFTFAAADDTYIVLPGITVLSTGSIAIAGTQSDCDLSIFGTVANGSVSSAVSMGTGAQVTIGTGGVVVSSAALGNGAILASANSSVVNNGSIVTPEGIGVILAGNASHVLNTGTITGGADGVFMGLFGATENSLVNYGRILAGNPSAGGRFGHGVHVEGDNTRVINYGEIAAVSALGAAVHVGDANAPGSGNQTLIVNHGTMSSAGFVAVDLGGMGVGEAATIRNFGTMDGGIIGSTGADSMLNRGVIVGDLVLGEGSDVLDARGGTVTGTIFGGDGDDRIRVSDATLVLSEGVAKGFDTVESTVTWVLGTNFEALVLIGSEDADGYGNTENNLMDGNAADNRLVGGSGSDTITGLAGNDVLDGGADGDQCFGGTGDDQVRGRDGSDNLSGAVGEDRLFGGSGNDTLNAGDGDDVLFGGTGQDRMTGGLDADLFVFLSATESGTTPLTRDTVLDFTSNEDRIDLSAMDASAARAGDQAFSFVGTAAFGNVAGQLRQAAQGANLLLEGDIDGDGTADFRIQVNGVSGFAAGDLIL